MQRMDRWGKKLRAVTVPESSEAIMQYALMVLVLLVMELVLAQNLEDVPMALTRMVTVKV
ncbi:MAG: hypothetical protein DLM72_20350 [Candidatus Nitrosopolaris wilkensis]|nr:MAG: hypothetical protein DLM72_20350 [Candidatus Nitrosopolaris wilkensis]